MLHPLLYTSLRLSPLRPYSNAVLARMLHPNIDYGHPTPRWFIQPLSNYHKSAAEDPTEKQSTAEKESVGDSDPRMIFTETEFQIVREQYNMPKYVYLPTPLFRVDLIVDTGFVSRITRV